MENKQATTSKEIPTPNLRHCLFDQFFLDFPCLLCTDALLLSFSIVMSLAFSFVGKSDCFEVNDEYNPKRDEEEEDDDEDDDEEEYDEDDDDGKKKSSGSIIGVGRVFHFFDIEGVAVLLSEAEKENDEEDEEMNAGDEETTKGGDEENELGLLLEFEFEFEFEFELGEDNTNKFVAEGDASSSTKRSARS
jgi:hypothetical protein